MFKDTNQRLNDLQTKIENDYFIKEMEEKLTQAQQDQIIQNNKILMVE